MASRWYITPIVGTGQGLYGPSADYYRPKLPAGATRLWVSIPLDANGAPRFAWALAYVVAASVAALDSDASVDNLPDAPLDATLSSVLTNNQVNGVLNKLANRGVSTSGLSGASTIRQVIERIEQTHTPGFLAAGVTV